MAVRVGTPGQKIRSARYCRTKVEACAFTERREFAARDSSAARRELRTGVKVRNSRMALISTFCGPTAERNCTTSDGTHTR